MAEIRYSLSTPSGEVLWESSNSDPTRPDIGNPILELAEPLYFDAEDMLVDVGLTVRDIRLRALTLVDQQPRTNIVAHPTVLEDTARANQEVSLWHLPASTLNIPELDRLYKGPLLSMARLRVPQEEVQLMGDDEDQFCLFVTEVKPDGSRMDIHRDGRRAIIVNLSEHEHRGRSLLGHPDLLRYGEITVDMLLSDDRTLVQRMLPGCGVAFDVTGIPHVGVSDPGDGGYRVILDADYRIVGKGVDLSVYESYE